jgi:hypothetical protein
MSDAPRRRFVYEVPMISGEVAMFDIPDGFTERDAERMCNMISAVLMGVPTPTGAERYFAERMKDPDYLAAYERAASEIEGQDNDEST